MNDIDQKSTAASPLVAISRFTVANGMTREVKDAFRNRPGYVNDKPGFVKMDVISPVDNPDEIWLVTYWTDRASYDSWHSSPDRRQSQQFIPKGMKVVPGSTSITFYEHVSS
jgi:heme-degrading monooxygenase HmoA